jgi:hypothetical protein
MFTTPISHVVNRNGEPIARATLQFFSGETDAGLATYRDAARSAAHPEVVTADLAGRFPLVMLPYATASVTTYRVRCTDARGGVIYEAKGLPLPNESVAATLALPLVPASDGGSASSITLTAASFRGLLSVNASSSDVPVVLPAPATLTPGQSMTIRQRGAGAAVIVQSHNGVVLVGSTPGYPLRTTDEEITILATATGFQAFGAPPGPVLIIQSSSDTPAPGAIPGAWYLATITTGPWIKDRLYRDNGIGGWIERQPHEGLLVLVSSELTGGSPTPYCWSGSAWTPWAVRSGTTAAEVMTVQVQAASGTPGGIPVYGAWTRTDLTAALETAITGASLANGQITLPAGTYDIEGWRSLTGVMAAAIRFHSPSSSKSVQGPSVHLQGEVETLSADALGNLTESTTAPGAGDVQIATRVGGTLVCSGRIVLTTADTFELQYIAHAPTGGGYSIDLGAPLGTGAAEVYGQVTIRKR